MPRLARLDAPGVLHHVMIRGIERRKIFRDDTDRDNLVERISTLLPETKTACYAWAFMPNHAHFLFRTGEVPLSTLMRRLLTGYAVSFNRRHKRHGQLFQNRYKSIVCQEDAYLQELVRYIHLNPVRAKIVSEIKELHQYPYSGHSVLMGKKQHHWQDSKYVLKFFGRTLRDGRKRYFSYVKAGADQGRRDELSGGGLIRSLGGWAELNTLKLKGKARIKGDVRILGDSDFVIDVLTESEEKVNRQYKLRSLGYDFDKLLERVSEIYQLDPQYIFSKGRQKTKVEARSLLCYWGARELGITLTELAQKLNMSLSSVSYSVQRGEDIAIEKSYKILK